MSTTSAGMDNAQIPENVTVRGQLDYLMEQYKLYHVHINNMFNYFLVTEGLIANAYVVSLAAEKDIGASIPSTIAIFGSIATFLLWLVHIRSRALLTTIENLLEKQEHILFLGEKAFFTFGGKKGFFLLRHKWHFPIIYGLFFLAFVMAAAYPHVGRLQAVVACFSAIPQ